MRKVRKAVLPVAGLGTRFLPATKATPKEMLTVVDKPIIQYVVEEALEAGIEEFVFVTGRGKTAIENHFDRPYELMDILEKKGKHDLLDKVAHIMPASSRIYYTRQGNPLGLGHAIACAASVIGDEPFAVLLPDVVACTERANPTAEAIKLYEETGKSVVVANEVPMERVKNYGILDLGGKGLVNDTAEVTRFVEKPKIDEAPSNLAIFGRYVLTPRHMQVLPTIQPGAGNEIQLTDGIDVVRQEEGCMGYVFRGEHFDCGDKVGFQMANLYFAMKDAYTGPRLLPYLHQMADQYERRDGKREAV